ncbi:MAG: putative ferredoxin reductase [Arthrobacter koreensis]|jgi:3-phenylpropionate/trans-cinnamate dioxygenase ferredoxin reductase subunit|uniref:NAD(P)/FAD-dependent oxidoreductase n=1 Tax=Arthrobacter koreensis TaxID=199136 RepID=UPI0024091FBC|nr:FAD-dependent oxidoreductase [Arthrobacter koreensis]MDF2498340.1 putative ferredoxin reductase [Arthrobacter koreensis]
MSVVIIGGGQAGLQVADSLRSGGYPEAVTVIANEPGLPYQRPPLSKDYLSPEGSPAPLPLRAASFFADKEITLRSGVRAAAVDRAARTVTLGNGEQVDYRHLVFATGAANRALTCPGADLPGVHLLRTLSDAAALHADLAAARRVVVVGAGFIGLEVAAAARARGCEVTVLEFAPGPMGRALSPVTGAWFAAAHTRAGIRLQFSEGIASLEPGMDGRVGWAVSTTGARYRADLVVAGIGVVPNDALAAAAGLETGNGIVVDAALRTSDPSVLAVGDCASFPSAHTGARIRVESVQNATDQGRHAARTILGAAEPYTDLPWFWSNQGSLRLQIAGLSAPGDQLVTSGDPESGKFSVLCFRDGRLAAVESVNSPGEHLGARKLLAAGISPAPEEVTVPGFSLKTLARQAVAAASPA